MNLYYIKIKGTNVYVRYVLINTNNTTELNITPYLEFGLENAAVYEEDKALKYLDILNKDRVLNTSFELENVKSFNYRFLIGF